MDTTTAAILYAIGGKDGDGNTVATVYRAHVDLDGSVQAWQPSSPLPVAVHGAGAVIFRGYLYVAGGADQDNLATDAAWRARVNPDGSLGTWQSIPALPVARAYFSLVNFGP